MDGHPIPRQITTFEFKLIGFMTLRQFLYLVVTIPTAYIVFQLFPIPLVNLLLAVVIATAGVVTAFMPIKDKTLDVWLKLVWKRLQQPTQYYYHKKNDPLYFLRDLYFLADPHHMLAHVESKEKLSQYLAMTKQKPKANYQKKQVTNLLHTSSEVLQKATDPVLPIATAPVMPVPQSLPPNPVPPVVAHADAMARVATSPQPIPVHAQDKPPVLQVVEPVDEPVMEPQTVIPPVAPTQRAVLRPTPPVMPAPVMPQPVVVPSTAPFFAGVVRTAKKIPLPGVLIYVKDGQGNALRILKTNPHGVFATYQPLPAGSYTFEIKDPNGTYFFDTMNKTIADQNLDPLEFMSKEIL